MNKIKINLPEKPYSFYLGENIFDKLDKFINKNYPAHSVFIVVDKTVYKLYKLRVDSFLKSIKNKSNKFILTASEENKSFESLKKIHSSLIKNNFGRDTLLAAIGGGIIGDLAGFAAATFMRGIPFAQVPTTLLAMVDSSVGGKTGINFSNTKNVIGAFYQPGFIYADTSFLKTLPKKEFICGVGEIVKYAFLTNKYFFNFLTRNFEKAINGDTNVLNRLIRNSVAYKGSVVAEDEKESGLRKVLNLGHTFAHALEVEQDHKIKHGEAVIFGLACALYTSKEIGILTVDRFKRYFNLIREFQDLITINSFDKRKIYNIMLRDKKNLQGKVKFVLLSGIGDILLNVEVDKKVLYSSLEAGERYFQKSK